MKNKVSIISIIIIIIGIIVVAAVGLNVNLKYRAHKAVFVSLGEEYNVADIENIANDVFGKNKAVVERSGLYNDEFVIRSLDITDEQLDSIKNKLNEKYNINQKILVSIGDDYTVEDVQAIANEVFSSTDTKVEKSEDDEKYASIDAKLVTEEDIENLNNKINEKYSLSNEADSISATNMIFKEDIPRVRLIDMAKQYMLYTVVATVIVLIYFGVRYKKVGLARVVSEPVALLLWTELLYLAVVAITRISVNKFVIIGAFSIYLIVITYLNSKYLDESVK